MQIDTAHIVYYLTCWWWLHFSGEHQWKTGRKEDWSSRGNNESKVLWRNGPECCRYSTHLKHTF